MRASRLRYPARRSLRLPRPRPIFLRPLQLSLLLVQGLLVQGLLVLGLLVAPALASAQAHPGLAVAVDEGDATLKSAKSLAKQLLQVPSAERRSEILGEMIDLADGHTPAAFVLRDALIEMWTAANKRLGHKSSLRAFKKLLSARERLDKLRVATLGIIRDKDAYPYPCTAPDATPEAIKAFTEAQAEIDQSVELMRELWRESPSVKVPPVMHAQLDRAMWVVRAKKRVGKTLGLNIRFEAPDLPPWVYGLPLRGEVEGDLVTLPLLGLTLAEQKTLEKNRAIRALNRRLQAETLVHAKDQFARDRIVDEFRQVEHTNNYRELFGLHALAWDVRLFEATRQHADYLWRSGEFTHFQPDAEFHTFLARAERAGYTEQVYENCHRGSNDPYDAHDVLCHSSEHHRTILLENVHEIATARSGLVWVQNYGLDTGFRSAIQWGAWRD